MEEKEKTKVDQDAETVILPKRKYHKPGFIKLASSLDTATCGTGSSPGGGICETGSSPS